MKIAIINHDISVYGASKSLRTYLPELSKHHDVTLFLPVNLHTLFHDITEYKIFFGVSKIEKIYQPFSLSFIGSPAEKMKKIKFFLRNIIFYILKPLLLSKIKKGCFDVIILNSLVLYPIIDKTLPFILHVRESAVLHKSMINKISEARKILFIDYSTQSFFSLTDSIISKSVVLNNPFNMIPKHNTGVVNSRIDNKKIICAVIGQISEVKGIDFVLKSFSSLDTNKYQLLIIGKINNTVYAKECLSYQTDNILFLNEIHDLEPYYSIIDVIIRGESFFTIGRTSYEGLYSGCNILIPGMEIDRNSFFDYDKFSRNIYFYEPRNEYSFTNSLISISKINKHQYYSNVDVYIESFNSILTSI